MNSFSCDNRKPIFFVHHELKPNDMLSLKLLWIYEWKCICFWCFSAFHIFPFQLSNNNEVNK